jgi:hypothetical protein
LAMVLHCELEECKLLIKNSKVYQWPNECIGTSKYFGCPKCACMMAMCPGNVSFTLGVANTEGRLLKVDYLNHI